MPQGVNRSWIFHIEGGYFEDTKVATALIVLRKGKTDGRITFADHETGKEYVADFGEIQRNDFNLSPSAYIPQEEKAVDFDPEAKEKEARADILRRLRAQLEFSKATIQLHHMLGLPPLPPISEFVTDIRQIINQYE